MVNIGTKFTSADNSGIKKVKTINLLNRAKHLNINTLTVAVVEKGKRIKTRIKKSDIIKTIILKTKTYNYKNHKGFKFNRNAVALMGENKLMCSKLKGILPSTIKHHTYKSKINLKNTTFI